MHGLQAEVAAAVEELGELTLPENTELLEVAGKGRCSVTFKANYRDEIVALKAYRPEIVKQYRKKYDVNIAVFEMSRNREFRKVRELFPYSAKPIMVQGHDGSVSLCFMQEFIEGIPLTQLAEQNRGLPASVLEAGELIARAAGQAGLHDLDLDYKNVLVRQQSGRWLPVIHDFNQVPGDHSGSGAIMGLLKKGMGRKPKDNYQYIQQWLQYSEQCGK